MPTGTWYLRFYRNCGLAHGKESQEAGTDAWYALFKEIVK